MNKTNKYLIIILLVVSYIICYGVTKAINHHYRVELMIAELEIFGNNETN